VQTIPLVRFPANSGSISLVRSDFEVSARRLIPLIEHGLDIEDLFVGSEAARPLVGPVAGVFIDVDRKRHKAIIALTTVRCERLDQSLSSDGAFSYAASTSVFSKILR